jgi:SAM-dependent methyltransferase
MQRVEPAGGGQFLYDRVEYPGNAYRHTHPNNLAARAAVRGLSPASPRHCRMLELGCGDGANLIPIAYQYPDSKFVGLDLSQRAVAKAKADADALGLRNVTFQCRDLATVSAQDGQFDYIVAHGVFSWIPAALRERLLAICKQCLSRQGVAYVSYNAYPGAHVRNIARSIMLSQDSEMADPRERPARARAFLDFVAQAAGKATPYGALLQAEVRRLGDRPDEVLLHDELGANFESFLLTGFVADANRSGLQYIGDADVTQGNFYKYDQEVREEISATDLPILARDQLMDFIDGRTFCRTLLCHGERRLIEGPPAENFGKLWFSSLPRKSAEHPGAEGAGASRFETAAGATVTVKSPQFVAALRLLDEAVPGALKMSDIAAHRDVIRPAADGGRADSASDLATFLWYAALCGVVEVLFESPQLAQVTSQKPEGSAWARRQAATGALVTTLRHTMVKLDEVMRQFLVLLDGTRSREQLAVEMSELVRRDPEAKPPGPEDIARHIDHVRRLGLLVA